MKKRITGIIVCLAMICGFIPYTAAADSQESPVQMGTGSIAAKDDVYYGSYGGPLAWRVLDAKTTNTDEKKEGMFLITKYAFYGVQFNKSRDDGNSYHGTGTDEQSYLKSWCEDFYENNFSGIEKSGVIDTRKTDIAYDEKNYTAVNLNGDRVFSLSGHEVLEYFEGDSWENNEDRIAKRQDLTNVLAFWWLRSPVGTGTTNAGLVDGAGFLQLDYVDTDGFSARPAFNLNLSSILFTSAAGGGKSSQGMENGLTEIVPSSDDITEWKLTLLDSNRQEFKAEAIKIGNTEYIAWSGAETGNKEYLSAMVCDSNNNVKYYGRLQNLNEKSESSGKMALTSEFTGKIGTGGTLYVFNEQYNGDKLSDYASSLKEVSIPADANAYDVSTELENLSFEGTSYILMSVSNDYTATLTANKNYILPKTITVSVGGSELTAGENTYSYDSSTGEITIKSNAISGNIEIKAVARLTPEATPAAEINYGEETLTELTAGNYTIQTDNGSPENVSINADGTLKIKEEWLGKTLSIVKEGNGTTTSDSAAQTLSIPTRLAKPTGLVAEDETVDGNSDGKITGTMSGMEYRLKAQQGQPENQWQDCGENSTENLAPGTYEVRYKAVTTGQGAFVSAAVEITIGKGAARNYSINVSAPGFTDVEYGYNRTDAQEVSIENKGNVPVTITKAELTGTDSNVFELKRTDGETGNIAIAVNDKNETYTVQPKADLSAGEYEASVQVTYQTDSGIATSTADVTFKVEKAAPEASDFTFKAPENTEYDGTEKTATVTLKDGLTGIGAITVSYYDKDGNKLDSPPKEVGTYFVKIDVAEGDNYNAAAEIADVSWSFEIKEKQEQTEPTDLTDPENPTNPTEPLKPEKPEAPTDPSGPSGQSGQGNQGGPRETATGDDSNLIFAGILALAAAAIAAGAVVWGRKKQQR